LYCAFRSRRIFEQRAPWLSPKLIINTPLRQTNGRKFVRKLGLKRYYRGEAIACETAEQFAWGVLVNFPPAGERDVFGSDCE
jgi:hypothetical protein